MGKSKKDQALERVLGATKAMFLGPAGDELAHAIVEAIEIMVAKPKKGETTEGSRVWAAYEQAMLARHGIQPKRNKTTNNQAKQLVERLGVDDAIAVVQFYVAHNNAYYVRNVHPFGICLKDAEALFGQMEKGETLTQRAAQKLETGSATLSASKSYLAQKYGQPAQAPEGGST